MKPELNERGNYQITFTTELVYETSNFVSDAGKHQSTMEIWTHEDKTPSMIEWDIPALEETEHIGLWFEDKKLVDYDGIMGEMPTQAIEMLEALGYDMTYARTDVEECWNCEKVFEVDALNNYEVYCSRACKESYANKSGW